MKVQGIVVPHSESIWEKRSGLEVLFIQGKKMVSLPNSSGRKTDSPKDFFSNHEYKSTTEMTC